VAKINSNIKNTAAELKRLIGRRWDEADLQEDLKMFPFKVTKAPDGGILINLMYEKVCFFFWRVCLLFCGTCDGVLLCVMCAAFLST
jgi:hypothetical protein